MIPPWYAALKNAHSFLKQGGHLGIVDFFVAPKYPSDGRTKHTWLMRTFWRIWFDADNVFLSPDHMPVIADMFKTIKLHEKYGPVPLVPYLKTPHYVFLGQKE
mmetsp:Transcript_29410/g.32697  ORF Transcript_29410/g.32697 Transcript_29410/m.32697 type:complete len:103 (-) Transcript_29410:25-333(-)